MTSFNWLALLALFVASSATSATAAIQQPRNSDSVIIWAGARIADERSCQQLDKAVTERTRIVAKINPDDRETKLAVNRAYHRITAARIDCKHGRIERGRTRYAQALEDLLGLPPALAEAPKNDVGSP